MNQINVHRPHNGSICPEIAARQKRIQELFAADKQNDYVPPPPTTTRSFKKERTWGKPKLKQEAQHNDKTSAIFPKKKREPVVESDGEDPTEDCTENLEDSLSSSSGLFSQNSGPCSFHTSLSSISEPGGEPEPELQKASPPRKASPPTTARITKQPPAPKPVIAKPVVATSPTTTTKPPLRQRSSSSLYAARQQQERTKAAAAATTADRKKAQRSKSTSVLLPKAAGTIHREREHRDMLDKANFALQMQDEVHAQRRAADGARFDLVSNSLPIGEQRQAQRQERLRQAKERVRLEQQEKENQKKQMSNEQAEARRCTQVYQWYIQHGMPSRDKMKERIVVSSSSRFVEADVDLLPWMAGGYIVDASAMGRIQKSLL